MSDGSDYLIKQYADNTSLLLNGSKRSSNQTLYIVDGFVSCSGLSAK